MNSGPIDLYNVSSLAISTGPVLTGHTNNVNSIVQINANQVATSSDDATIKVWNIATNALANTYYGHSVSVGAMCVLPNGNLVSSGGDSTLRVWNMQLQTVNTVVSSLPGSINNMVVNPVDGSLVLNIPNTLMFYNTTSWTLTKSFSTGVNYPKIIVVPGSGNILAVSIIWEVWNSTGSRIFSQQWSTSGTVGLILLPDNVTAVGCRLTGVLQPFNVITNTVGTAVAGHTNWAVALSLTPDHVYIISSGWDNMVIIWTWTTMSVTKVNSYPATENSFSMIIVGTPYSGNIFLYISYFYLDAVIRTTASPMLHG
jgi:WD40 repeat protein